jgi:hypothetical protein
LYGGRCDAVYYFDAGVYSEAGASITLSLLKRKNTVNTRDLPEAPLVENIGVWPDVTAEYMTRETS